MEEIFMDYQVNYLQKIISEKTVRIYVKILGLQKYKSSNEKSKYKRITR
jgi:hypothetical protein